MSNSGTNDPIPADIAEFLELYEQRLDGVQFPDVSRDRLRELSARACAEAEALEALHEQVRVQRQALDRARAALRRAAERGLAYAKVYADGDEPLAAELGALRLAHGGEAKPARKRRTRGKAKAKAANEGERPGKEIPTGELPFAAGAEVSDAA
ncbi:hypothetical protein [Haliangium sp.]|uniref:hypothetical protein n=1 Tax=Haliangium sp. TaxID=2663208 RepID=UPI003D0CBE02